jgi:hypothetical protein
LRQGGDEPPCSSRRLSLLSRSLHLSLFQQILDRFVDPVADKLVTAKIIFQQYSKIIFDAGSQPPDASVKMFLVWLLEITLRREGEI